MEEIINKIEAELYNHDFDMDGFGNGYEDGLKKAIEIINSSIL